jgi:hypothetical protein
LIDSASPFFKDKDDDDERSKECATASRSRCKCASINSSLERFNKGMVVLAEDATDAEARIASVADATANESRAENKKV